MKKILTIFLGALLLAGCTNEKEVLETETVIDTEHETVVEPEVEAALPETNHSLSNLPEFNTLAENIDLITYTASIETDNKGTRVILFGDTTGKKEYKSIFVKHDNRLKIIKLDNDDLIYNSIIK